MDTKQLLGKQQVQPGNSHTLEFENEKITITREKEGWSFLSSNNGQKEYYHTGKSNSLVIQPSLPEKPLVFKGSRMNVSPRQKLTFFLRIPLSIQIYFSKVVPENLIKTIAVARLSDTWFGEPDTGEAAFALGNSYFLSMEEIATTDFEAICPVVIFNNSTTVLEVERLIIRTENMALFRNAGKIVTSVVQVEYRGKEITSSAEYHYSKLFNGEKQDTIAKPRNGSGKSTLKINFHFIKNIYRTE